MNKLFTFLTSKLKSASLISLTLVMFILAGCASTLEVPPVLNSIPSASVEHIADSIENSVAEASNEANEAFEANEAINSSEPLTSFADVAQYLREHNQLPSNYITKNEAKSLGWVASEGNLHIVAPGMSIGGDRFGNREGLLPKASGRTWYEADIDYESGTRNAKRIVFSNDGLIYMTADHYASFTNITDEGSVIDE